MARFDRFDICEAYLAAEWDYNSGGWLQERPSNRRRREAISIQLGRLGFKAGQGFNGLSSLSENGREIYRELILRLGLEKEGYCDCACRDCMNGPIIGLAGVDMCDECQGAGCELDSECKREDAYSDDSETEDCDNEEA